MRDGSSLLVLAVAVMALTKTSAASSAFPPMPKKTVRPVSHAFDLSDKIFVERWPKRG